ncbi:MAG: hypothetical protein HFH91_18855 [Lachnospiraceae bacterium]|nr:hypothetical protein [Lachnospiraceae bacterium]
MNIKRTAGDIPSEKIFPRKVGPNIEKTDNFQGKEENSPPKEGKGRWRRKEYRWES